MKIKRSLSIIILTVVAIAILACSAPAAPIPVSPPPSQQANTLPAATAVPHTDQPADSPVPSTTTRPPASSSAPTPATPTAAAPTPDPTATLPPTPTQTKSASARSTADPTATLSPASNAAPQLDPSPTPTLETAVVTIIVATGITNVPQYSRSDWRHWTDDDGDCVNVRHEVLLAESSVPVDFKTPAGCQVAAGQWYAPFTGQIVTDASQLDVDHMVPLANAHRSGGWAWSPAEKRRYANDLLHPEHLVAVTSSANRSKSDQGPESWKPADRSYWCQYATDWANIKHRWELTATQAEAQALVDMLDTCASVPQIRMGQKLFMSPKPPINTPAERFDSCEAAWASGVKPVTGAKGAGKGFRKSVVPSARDGDGDGVVCEK